MGINKESLQSDLNNVRNTKDAIVDIATTHLNPQEIEQKQQFIVSERVKYPLGNHPDEQLFHRWELMIRNYNTALENSRSAQAAAVPDAKQATSPFVLGKNAVKLPNTSTEVQSEMTELKDDAGREMNNILASGDPRKIQKALEFTEALTTMDVQANWLDAHEKELLKPYIPTLKGLAGTLLIEALTNQGYSFNFNQKGGLDITSTSKDTVGAAETENVINTYVNNPSSNLHEIIKAGMLYTGGSLSRYTEGLKDASGKIINPAGLTPVAYTDYLKGLGNAATPIEKMIKNNPQILSGIDFAAYARGTENIVPVLDKAKEYASDPKVGMAAKNAMNANGGNNGETSLSGSNPTVHTEEVLANWKSHPLQRGFQEVALIAKKGFGEITANGETMAGAAIAFIATWFYSDFKTAITGFLAAIGIAGGYDRITGEHIKTADEAKDAVTASVSPTETYSMEIARNGLSGSYEKYRDMIESGLSGANFLELANWSQGKIQDIPTSVQNLVKDEKDPNIKQEKIQFIKDYISKMYYGQESANKTNLVTAGTGGKNMTLAEVKKVVYDDMAQQIHYTKEQAESILKDPNATPEQKATAQSIIDAIGSANGGSPKEGGSWFMLSIFALVGVGLWCKAKKSMTIFQLVKNTAEFATKKANVSGGYKALGEQIVGRNISNSMNADARKILDEKYHAAAEISEKYKKNISDLESKIAAEKDEGKKVKLEKQLDSVKKLHQAAEKNTLILEEKVIADDQKIASDKAAKEAAAERVKVRGLTEREIPSGTFGADIHETSPISDQKPTLQSIQEGHAIANTKGLTDKLTQIESQFPSLARSLDNQKLSELKTSFDEMKQIATEMDAMSGPTKNIFANGVKTNELNARLLNTLGKLDDGVLTALETHSDNIVKNLGRELKAMKAASSTVRGVELLTKLRSILK